MTHTHTHTQKARERKDKRRPLHPKTLRAEQEVDERKEGRVWGVSFGVGGLGRGRAVGAAFLKRPGPSVCGGLGGRISGDLESGNYPCP